MASEAAGATADPAACDKKPAAMGSPALNLCILVAPRALSLRIPLNDAAASL